jgi:type I restriction enzyme M protein
MARDRSRKDAPASPGKNNKPSTSLGFESKLWAMANKLRSNMDAADYKHIVLGLIFLKFISDKFEAKRAELVATPNADPEERDEYIAQNVFWVPKGARWSEIQDKAKLPTIGQEVDAAMAAIEDENPTLKGVLPKTTYGRADLDKRLLGEVIDLVGKIELLARDENGGAQDLLGRVYEYFIGQFAAAEGKKGGQFYTPTCIVELLVRMIEPYNGRVFDPCFGSGGMFVQSEKFVEAHGGGRDDISIYGEESNPQTWRLGKMNLAIRGITANLGPRAADSFHDDLHKDLKADFVLANPPFNVSDWGGERRRQDTRWKFGVPPISPGCSTSSTISHHMGLRDSCWRTARCPQTSLAKARLERRSSRPTSSIASCRCRVSSSTQRRYPFPSGSSLATSRTASSRTSGCATDGERLCSSMLVLLAVWKRARSASSTMSMIRRMVERMISAESSSPTMLGGKLAPVMRTRRASAKQSRPSRS